VNIRPFRPVDESPVLALWRACDLLRPQNDPVKDIARKLKVNPEWFLVAEENGQIVGTVMAGYEGHRGWINYLAAAPSKRGTGVGRALMAEAERLLRGAGCPKINLQVRTGNTEAAQFYRRIGFVQDEAISFGKRLEAD
jgi:ribosomal protein S18 acetylase RimI-like enzyme